MIARKYDKKRDHRRKQNSTLQIILQLLEEEEINSAKVDTKIRVRKKITPP